VKCTQTAHTLSMGLIISPLKHIPLFWMFTIREWMRKSESLQIKTLHSFGCYYSNSDLLTILGSLSLSHSHWLTDSHLANIFNFHLKTVFHIYFILIIYSILSTYSHVFTVCSFNSQQKPIHILCTNLVIVNNIIIGVKSILEYI